MYSWTAQFRHPGTGFIITYTYFYTSANKSYQGCLLPSNIPLLYFVNLHTKNHKYSFPIESLNVAYFCRKSLTFHLFSVRKKDTRGVAKHRTHTHTQNGHLEKYISPNFTWSTGIVRMIPLPWGQIERDEKERHEQKLHIPFAINLWAIRVGKWASQAK